MLEQLSKVYGLELAVSGEIQLRDIPIYMAAGRKFFEAECCGVRFLLVSIPEADRLGGVALGKQLVKYRSASEFPVAFLLDRLTYSQRTALIQKQIPFISEPDQIYLPFLGVMLRNTLSHAAPVQTDKMMPATQMLFLLLAYRGQDGFLKKDAAEYLGLTRASVTRASAQLAAMGLIREERNGKEVRMYPVNSGMAYYRAARPYLVNPVQKTVYARLDAEGQGFVRCGESALASGTMLNPPGIPEAAIGKDDEIIKEMQIIDPKWEDAAGVSKIEIWKYAPELFAPNGCVDPISLAMSLEGNGDERIEDALEEYMEAYKW